MAKLPVNFDASTVKPSAALEPMPTDWYKMKIIDTDYVPTNKKDGHMLLVKLEVTEGEYAGRKAFDQLNLDNPNEQAVEIARASLSAICHATGVIQLGDDTEQLHGIEMMVRLGLQAASANGDARNVVRGYKQLEEGAPAAGFTPPTKAAPAKTAPAKTAPAKTAPAAAKPAAPKPAPKKKVLVPTDKADGVSLETFREDPDWTDELLVSEGYFEWQEVEDKPVAPAKPAGAPKPVKPVAEPAAEEAGEEEEEKAPWEE